MRQAARVALALASTALSLLAIELALTAWYGEFGERGPYELVEDWSSPFVFRQRGGGEGALRGVRRSAPTEPQAPPGTLRILSYGDSIAGGYLLDEAETYAHLAERALEARGGRKVEILEMGRGHSPTIHSFHLRSDVPRLRPDAVIMQIELSNDVSDEALAETVGRDEVSLPLRILRHRYILGWDGQILAPLAISGSFVERTKLYAKLSRWYGRVRERLAPNPLFADDSLVAYYSLSSDRFLLTPQRLEEGFERLFASLAAMHVYLERREVRFLVLIVPARQAFGDERVGASARALVARAEARARELGLPYLTPDEALARAGGASLYMDFCHPTRDGHRAIAAALEPVLAAWSEAPAASSRRGRMP